MRCDELSALALMRPLGVLDDDETRALDAHLASCATCPSQQELLDAALDSARAPERKAPDVWEKIERELARDATPEPTPVRVTLACTFCHDALEQAAAAYCGKCLAPHHADCFEEHGRCAALGCGGTKLVFAQAARPKWRWRFPLIVFFGSVASAAAFTETWRMSHEPAIATSPTPAAATMTFASKDLSPKETLERYLKISRDKEWPDRRTAPHDFAARAQELLTPLAIDLLDYELREPEEWAGRDVDVMHPLVVKITPGQGEKPDTAHAFYDWRSTFDLERTRDGWRVDRVLESEPYQLAFTIKLRLPCGLRYAPAPMPLFRRGRLTASFLREPFDGELHAHVEKLVHDGLATSKKTGFFIQGAFPRELAGWPIVLLAARSPEETVARAYIEVGDGELAIYELAGPPDVEKALHPVYKITGGNFADPVTAIIERSLLTLEPRKKFGPNKTPTGFALGPNDFPGLVRRASGDFTILTPGGCDVGAWSNGSEENSWSAERVAIELVEGGLMSVLAAASQHDGQLIRETNDATSLLKYRALWRRGERYDLVGAGVVETASGEKRGVIVRATGAGAASHGKIERDRLARILDSFAVSGAEEQWPAPDVASPWKLGDGASFAPPKGWRVEKTAAMPDEHTWFGQSGDRLTAEVVPATQTVEPGGEIAIVDLGNRTKLVLRAFAESPARAEKMKKLLEACKRTVQPTE